MIAPPLVLDPRRDEEGGEAEPERGADAPGGGAGDREQRDRAEHDAFGEGGLREKCRGRHVEPAIRRGRERRVRILWPGTVKPVCTYCAPIPQTGESEEA